MLTRSRPPLRPSTLTDWQFVLWARALLPASWVVTDAKPPLQGARVGGSFATIAESTVTFFSGAGGPPHNTQKTIAKVGAAAVAAQVEWDDDGVPRIDDLAFAVSSVPGRQTVPRG